MNGSCEGPASPHQQWRSVGSPPKHVTLLGRPRVKQQQLKAAAFGTHFPPKDGWGRPCCSPRACSVLTPPAVLPQAHPWRVGRETTEGRARIQACDPGLVCSHKERWFLRRHACTLEKKAAQEVETSSQERVSVSTWWPEDGIKEVPKGKLQRGCQPQLW